MMQSDISYRFHGLYSLKARLIEWDDNDILCLINIVLQIASLFDIYTILNKKCNIENLMNFIEIFQAIIAPNLLRHSTLWMCGFHGMMKIDGICLWKHLHIIGLIQWKNLVFHSTKSGRNILKIIKHTWLYPTKDTQTNDVNRLSITWLIHDKLNDILMNIVSAIITNERSLVII